MPDRHNLPRRTRAGASGGHVSDGQTLRALMQRRRAAVICLGGGRQRCVWSEGDRDVYGRAAAMCTAGRTEAVAARELHRTRQPPQTDRAVVLFERAEGARRLGLIRRQHEPRRRPPHHHRAPHHHRHLHAPRRPGLPKKKVDRPAHTTPHHHTPPHPRAPEHTTADHSRCEQEPAGAPHYLLVQ